MSKSMRFTPRDRQAFADVEAGGCIIRMVSR